MVELARIIPAVDVHTAGEPARVVLGGLPRVPGATMAEKKRFMADHLDHVRTVLMQEPRGHRDMFGVVLLSPTIEHADYGILFMDGAGYIDMCGHGVMAAATALIETGTVSPTGPETRIVFDTPAGLVEGRARVEGSRVLDVTVANVPSFLYAQDVEIRLVPHGSVGIDVAFGGNFFALVSADQLGVSVEPANHAELARLGTAIREAVNTAISVRHPILPHIDRVGLTKIYERPVPRKPFSKGVVIFGQGQVDRCPCGTGTSAAMAALRARGELPLNVEFVSEGIVGTRFHGKLVGEVSVGGIAAVQPVITGEAYITGIQQFVVDPRDPLRHGFTVG
jgi:proline racemase/trans-L-3-hydroxyproline dehydratase